jgi:thiamine pyrophosphate-dependent acetolactate synthase large subunit-like protein
MKRAVVAALIRDQLRASDLVVTSLGTTGRAWRESGATNSTYANSDPMGLSAALALGLSLARPDRRVIHLTGDGDLVMNLGVLVTIADTKAPNMFTVVFQNGKYETGGGQPLAAHDRINLALIAQGAGLTQVAEASSAEEAQSKLAGLLAGEGPALLVLHVDPEPSPYSPEGQWTQVERRAFFLQQLDQ